VEADTTELMPLVLRRANVSRKGGPWSETDYDVFEGKTQRGEFAMIRCILVALMLGTLPTFAGEDADKPEKEGIAGPKEAFDKAKEQVKEMDKKVQPAYLDMLRDAELLEIQRSNVSALEANLRQSRVRFTAREVTRTELAQAESSLAAGRSQLHAAELQYVTSKARYAQAVRELSEAADKETHQ
jgi:Outer membrane efflux protein